jgi:signal transduction histidine kinase
MNRTISARLLRVLLVACGAAFLLVAVVRAGALVQGSQQLVVLLPFMAAGLAVVGLGLVLPVVDRVVERLTGHREVTAYSALAEAAARISAGSLEQALPGLAEVVAGGTGATRAVLWLAVGERLVEGAQYPQAEPGSDSGRGPPPVANLAVLLARPDTDHVVPVLDGTVLRAALAIEKPNAPITRADRRLMQDVANGAGLLLRGVAQNAELAERVRRADALAAELQASRQRLATARDVERRRLVMELSHATTDPMAALRVEVGDARRTVGSRPEEAAVAQEMLARALAGLDDLLDRFRVIVRGVYPAVLRDQGPAAALDDVAADLARSVRLSGGLAERLDWEIESGIYYVAAAALHELAGRPAEQELVLHLEQADGRVTVLIEDPTPPVTAERLRTALADDVERLGALGGDLELSSAGGADPEAAAEVTLRAWLPERLEPLVESSAGAALRAS